MSLLRSLGARAEQCALRITRCNPAVYPTFYCQGAYPVIDTGDWKQPEYTVVHKLGIVKGCWAVSEVWPFNGQTAVTVCAVIELASGDFKVFNFENYEVVYTNFPGCGFDQSEELSLF